MLRLHEARAFKTHRKRLSASQKDELLIIVQKLLLKEPLEAGYKDHTLKGTFKGCRECHLEPNLLLVYEITDDHLILQDIGNHPQLFG